MLHAGCVLYGPVFYNLIIPLSHLGDEHADEHIYIALSYVVTIHRSTQSNYELVVIGLGRRALLAVKDSTTQPGSTPECSASVSKNHNTIYATPKGGEEGANRVRVMLGV